MSDGILFSDRYNANSLAPTRCCFAFFLAAQARCLSAFLTLAQNLFLARDFLFREHRSPAIFQAAIAGCFLAYIAIKEVVVIGELFSGFNVAEGHNPNAVVDLIGLAVWITCMVHERGHAKAVNNCVAVVHGEEVRNLCVGIHAFASLGSEPRAGIFENKRALFYGSRGVNASAMQRR
jgi:hypothetical protein